MDTESNFSILTPAETSSFCVKSISALTASISRVPEIEIGFVFKL